MKKAIRTLLINLFGTDKGVVARIKKHYKMNRFREYAQVGKDLDLCVRANCSAEKKGLIRIGDHCRVYGKLQSMGDGELIMGDYCAIMEDCIIGSVQSIRMGNYVGISNHVHIYDNNNHPTSPSVRKKMFIEGFEGDAWRWVHADSAPIVIEDNVWVGEYAAILKGVTIGTGAIVASHAVVTKDVPPYAIVAGNPARVVKVLENDEK